MKPGLRFNQVPGEAECKGHANLKQGAVLGDYRRSVLVKKETKSPLRQHRHHPREGGQSLGPGRAVQILIERAGIPTCSILLECAISEKEVDPMEEWSHTVGAAREVQSCREVARSIILTTLLEYGSALPLVLARRW